MPGCHNAGMNLKNTDQSYGTVAKGFHWLIALLIIGMIAMGFIMVGLNMSPDKIKIIGWHKSTGITILILASIRLGWKMANTSPLLPDSMKIVEKWLAHAGHAMLYLLMFAMPLTGWIMSSAAGFPVSVFGLFTLPNLVAPDNTLKAQMIDLHEMLAWVLIVMITLHVLAALLHHFYHKDNVLVRMLPFAKEKYALDSDTHTGC